MGNYSKKYNILIYRERGKKMTEQTAIETIEKDPENVNWRLLCMMHKLSEKFIEEHIDKVNWDSISFSQHLSEDFIRKYQDKVNWLHIFRVQDLSEEFIEEFRHKVSISDWEFINRTKHIFENPYPDEN